MPAEVLPAALAERWHPAQLWHPGVLALVLVTGAVYLAVIGPLGLRRKGKAGATPRQVVAFFVALAAVYVSEGSPLHLLSERYLFSAHMLQHVLLTLVLPPFLLLGLPAWVWRPLWRPRPLRWLLARVTRPVTALVAFNLLYSLYHWPALYQAGLQNEPVHLGQHAVLIVTALWMWWPVLSPLPEVPRLPEPLQLLYIFLLAVAQTVVFAVVTFADGPLYPLYARAPRVWGLSPLADQQLAGIIMKIGALAVLVPALVTIFFRWARREEAAGLGPHGEPSGRFSHR